jgi:hypothetical protein
LRIDSAITLRAELPVHRKRTLYALFSMADLCRYA